MFCTAVVVPLTAINVVFGSKKCIKKMCNRCCVLLILNRLLSVVVFSEGVDSHVDSLQLLIGKHADTLFLITYLVYNQV